MDDIIVHDVGLRDGLQVEQATVPTDRKVRWLETLIAAGIDVVQAGSFVSPKLLPQMADAEAIFTHFAGRKPPGTRLSALVLNEKGLDRALGCGVDYLCMGVSASDTHSRKNTGMGTAEAASRVLAMAHTARSAGAIVQLSVQSAFGCGYEGNIPLSRVLGLVDRFLARGFTRISLADTAGHATPPQVEACFRAVLRSAPDTICACHFHDTYGAAMANAWAAMNAGVRSFETAFAGLGGCPFTAIAGPNLCTEDFVHLLQRNARREEISLPLLIDLARDAEEVLGRPLPGIVHRVGPIASRTAVERR